MQVDECVDDNNLHEVFESAFKIRHSTETALHQVKKDIDLPFENHAAFVIMLDLSAAFNESACGLVEQCRTPVR